MHVLFGGDPDNQMVLMEPRTDWTRVCWNISRLELKSISRLWYNELNCLRLSLRAVQVKLTA